MRSPRQPEYASKRSTSAPKTDRDTDVKETFLREPSFPAESNIPADLTDVDELAPGEYSSAAEDRRQVMEAMDALSMSTETGEEGDWEKRMYLLRLINYVAEQENGESLADQSRRVVELMNMIPENEPVDPKVQRMIINLADKCLEQARRKAKAA